ncbi:MAG: DUF4097 family beta strand repeat protein [bacterium]|nr:DUF4097 family beta strand repeat protein [bacterium]
MSETIIINRPVEGITNVVLASFGNLVINQGNEDCLKIETTKKIEKILICKKEDSTLTLSLKNNNNWLYRFIGSFGNLKKKHLTYYLTLKNINKIITEGSGDIISENSITTDNLKLRLNGSGNIDLKTIKASHLDSFSLGSGNFSGESLEVGDCLQITIKGRGDIRLKDVNASEIALDSFGSGNFNSESMKIADQGRLKLIGSGNIKIGNLIINSLEAEITGTGNVKLSGVANSQGLSVRGSGDYSSKKFKTETANIEQSGSGDIYVNITKSISATCIGSGNLKIKGNPPERSVKISGKGSLKYTK